MKTFAENVREARTSMGMTQEELAKAVGVSSRSVKAYESGEKRAYERTIRQLAKALYVSAKYLSDDRCDDPNEGLEEEEILKNARRIAAEFDVRQMLLDNTALFAGGQLTQEQKDNYFKALMAAYEACRDVSEQKRETDGRQG